MIELKKIKKKYKLGKVSVPVLHGIDMKIEVGDFVAIMGPSGSGKSTLMSILGCLDTPTSGQYILNNEIVSGLKDNQLAGIRNKYIGFVFQTFNLLPRMKAIDNVRLPLLYAKSKKSIPLAEKALDEVGLSHRKTHKPTEMSGGEKQRVAIARAIVTKPAVVMADEPTGNLDSKTSYEIMQIFKNLNEKGTTILLVTHEEDIAEYAKRKIVLKDGMILSKLSRDTH
jgi:putative ABC transport system ATP-binding protein